MIKTTCSSVYSSWLLLSHVHNDYAYSTSHCRPKFGHNCWRRQWIILVILNMSAAIDTIDHDHVLVLSSGAQFWCSLLVLSSGAQFWCSVLVLSSGAQFWCSVLVLSSGAQFWCQWIFVCLFYIHNIGNHIYDDDTQIYYLIWVSGPFGILDKLNICIDNIRVWIIFTKNEFKLTIQKLNS